MRKTVHLSTSFQWEPGKKKKREGREGLIIRSLQTSERGRRGRDILGAFDWHAHLSQTKNKNGRERKKKKEKRKWPVHPASNLLEGQDERSPPLNGAVEKNKWGGGKK